MSNDRFLRRLVFSRNPALPAAWLWLLALSLVLGFSGPFAGASENQPTATPPSMAAGETPPPTAAVDAPSETPAPQPEEPAYEWILDPEWKQRYRVDKIPNMSSFRWLSENRVQVPLGVVFDVVKRDDDWVYVKIWEDVAAVNPPPQPKQAHEPTVKEIENTKASYVTETVEVDRLTFTPFDQGLPQKGQWRNSFGIGDLNGDGHLDIAFGPSRKGRARPNIFLGDSQGHWQWWEAAQFPNQPYDYGDTEVADFTGDGKPDLAFGIHLRGLLVLKSEGEGRFSPWSQGIALERPGQGDAATAFSSRSIGAIDWNKDGRLDLMALGEGPKGVKGGPKKIVGEMINTARGFVVFLNNGDGTWTPARIDEERDSSSMFDFGDDFAVGDFNRDGRFDVVSATNRLGNRWILGIGNENKTVKRQELTPIRARGFLRAVEVTDLNRDRTDDLVVSYLSRDLNDWRSGIDILLADGKLGWDRHPLVVNSTKVAFSAIGIGDLDGDKNSDLVTATEDGQILVFLGEGKKGKWSQELSPELPSAQAGCRGYDVQLVDLDGDHRDEIIIAFAGETEGLPSFGTTLSKEGCVGGGSIRVFKLGPAPAAPTKSAAATPARSN